MKAKPKSSYQSLIEKYHHAVVECEQKDKRIKELEKALKETEKPKGKEQSANVKSQYETLADFAAMRNACMLKAANKHIDELQKYKAEHQKDFIEKHREEFVSKFNNDLAELCMAGAPTSHDPYKHLYDALKAGKWVNTTDQHGNEVTVKGHAESIEFKLPACEYVIVEPEPVDPYKVFVDALNAGKEVWYTIQPGNKYKVTRINTSCPPENYEIREPEPVYTKFTKEELVSLVGKTIVNSTNPNRTCIITGTDGYGNAECSRILVSRENLVKYWLLDGKPCGKERK